MDTTIVGGITVAAVKLLAPYFAELLKGTASQTGKRAADGAIAKVGELYATIRQKFSGRSAAEEALTDLEKAPDDEDAQGALRIQLKKVLQEDPDFATRLAELLKGADAVGAGAVFNTNIKGEVKNVTNIHTVEGGLKIE